MDNAGDCCLGRNKMQVVRIQGAEQGDGAS